MPIAVNFSVLFDPFYTDIHTYIYIYMCVCVCVCVYIYIYACVYIGAFYSVSEAFLENARSRTDTCTRRCIDLQYSNRATQERAAYWNFFYAHLHNFCTRTSTYIYIKSYIYICICISSFVCDTPSCLFSLTHSTFITHTRSLFCSKKNNRYVYYTYICTHTSIIYVYICINTMNGVSKYVAQTSSFVEGNYEPAHPTPTHFSSI